MTIMPSPAQPSIDMNYRRIYESIIQRANLRAHVSENQKHHIIPRHLGGTDDPENIISLTFKEHYLIHYLRWKIFGSEDDLSAYRMMRGIKTSEAHKFFARKGGYIGGQKNAESGLFDRIKTFESMSKGGKAGAATNKKNKAGAFFDKEEHRRVAAMGGHVVGLMNVASGHLKRISKLSKRNTGMFWITDGQSSKMTSGFIPTGWRRGRICRRIHA